MNSQRKKVLIIGAGPSGLSLLRAFQQDEQKLQKSPIISCYQKQQQWGGQWNYFTKVKLDKFGLPIPSTNQYLWTNAPKQCFQYPDYSFDEHFNGIPMPSYLPRQYLKEYFTKRFQKNDIKKYITFGTIVKNIKYNKQENYFKVQSQNLNTLQKKTQLFDYVVVASGHFAKPNIPNFEGLRQFKGKLVHSIQIQDYEDFKNQDILIVGTGLSAEDAVLQSYKYGAQSIAVTYRTRPMSQKFPKQIDQFPLIAKIQNKSVTFSNGQKKQFDTIILCTGYTHNFSFLDPQIRLETTGKLWSQDLYMGVILQKNPKIMYIGMQAQYFSFMMFDIQSYLIRDFVLEKIKLPSIIEMKKDGENRAEFQRSIQNPYDIIQFMGKYMKQMMELAQYPDYNIDKVILLYIQLQRHKQSDIISFRDHMYESTVTGTWSIKRSQSWLESGAQFQNQENLLDNFMEGKFEVEIKSSY